MAKVLHEEDLYKYDIPEMSLEEAYEQLTSAYTNINKALNTFENLRHEEKKFVGTDVRKMIRNLNKAQENLEQNLAKTSQMQSKTKTRNTANTINNNIARFSKSNTKANITNTLITAAPKSKNSYSFSR